MFISLRARQVFLYGARCGCGKAAQILVQSPNKQQWTLKIKMQTQTGLQEELAEVPRHTQTPKRMTRSNKYDVTGSKCLPVVKFDRYNVSSEERGEERDGEVMQLVDGNLHWCFREHLRAHVEEHTPLDYTSRHVCDRFLFLFS